MPLEIVTVPCRTDNYAYLLRDAATGKIGLVDAPDAGPIAAALAERGWGLDAILITHHHDDHIEGVAALRERFGAEVIGAEADRHRLPRLDRAVTEGDEVALGESRARVIDVSGHTVGHVAYHFAEAGAVFTADSLMAMGCGRIFEGTAPMMWASLQKLAALPAETLVYSGHEYATANARFAVALDGATRRSARGRRRSRRRGRRACRRFR
jgi:hydroxyacylglutathione hydrolase